MSTYGPREVAECWTLRQAKDAGIPFDAYRMSVRRKLRNAMVRERERWLWATID